MGSTSPPVRFRFQVRECVQGERHTSEYLTRKVSVLPLFSSRAVSARGSILVKKRKKEIMQCVLLLLDSCSCALQGHSRTTTLATCSRDCKGNFIFTAQWVNEKRLNWGGEIYRFNRLEWENREKITGYGVGGFRKREYEGLWGTTALFRRALTQTKKKKNQKKKIDDHTLSLLLSSSLNNTQIHFLFLFLFFFIPSLHLANSGKVV